VVAACSARGGRVILLETWPVGQPEWLRRPVWNDRIPFAVARLNEQLRLLAAPARNVQVLDLFQAAGFEPNQQFYRDALHFQPAVYQRLTPVLEKEIARIAVP
jgi:lysophospholipase L1-like esterase